MIFEALSTIKDTNGCDISAIVSYIEVRWVLLLLFLPLFLAATHVYRMLR